MATIRDPVLFSKHFDVDPARLAKLGVLDPMLNADTKLFIDPLLLRESRHPEISADAVACFDQYFGKVITLLQHSSVPGDVAWRNADRLFNFREVIETCIGYGGSTIHGSAIGPTLRARLMNTAKEIVELGVDNPELFVLLGLLEDDIGADRISDMTTTAILPALLKFNEVVLADLDVPTERFTFKTVSTALPRNPCESRRTGIILLPTDILRDLPIAHDWHDVADAADKNQELRDRVNERIGDIWAIKTREDKAQARIAALRSKQAFETLMAAVGVADKKAYDAVADPLGHYLWRDVSATIATKFPFPIRQPTAKNLDELERVVEQIVAHFQDLIEKNGLWYLLWHNGKARHEKAAQRLFFGIADAYCKANNLDISPETDSGAGPVDFKFSSGYDARVLVEIKLSTGKVVSGYRTQLEVYKDAEKTMRAFYLVVDVGGMGEKLEKIFDIRNAWVSSGLRASRIEVVDGEMKPSASKR